MDWPSVRLIAWWSGLLGLVWFGLSILLAVYLGHWLDERFGVSGDAFQYVFLVAFLAGGGVLIALTACPRCGRNAHSRGSYFDSFWPVRTCSKCGLDLRRFHPFDKRAKRP